MFRRQHLIFLPAAAALAGGVMFGCNRGGTDQSALPADPPPLSGPASYEKNCQGCHGAKGEGVGEYPGLQKLGVRIPDENIRHFIRNGRGDMPGFKQMSETELKALIAYIKRF